MDRLNVMAVTTCNGPSAQKAAGMYVIEHIKDGVPITKDGYLYRDSITGLDLTIQLLCNALYIVSKSNIEFENIVIFTEEPIVTSAFTQKWIDKWIANDWKNAKGKAIANTDDWKKLVDLLEGKADRYIFTNKNTSYFNYMKMWAEKYLKYKSL